MGGLGNGRRGGRAPPLMVAALIACILVLGFNYWVSSSRNLELQVGGPARMCLFVKNWSFIFLCSYKIKCIQDLHAVK